MARQELLTKLAMLGWPTPYGHIRWEKGDWIGYNHEAFPRTEGISKKEYLAERARLIAKPSWSEAPEWAGFQAQASSGLWAWHEHKPEPDAGIGNWRNAGRYYASNHRGAIPAGHDWRETLETRPEQNKESVMPEINWKRPPVNTICNARHLDNEDGDIEKVEVIAYDRGWVWLRRQNTSRTCPNLVWVACDGVFTPYVDPEQAAEDEAVERIEHVLRQLPLSQTTYKKTAHALYQAGLRFPEDLDS